MQNVSANLQNSNTDADACVTLQELNSTNYLELYRVADLFHLPVLEEAVVAFLVEHLSELSQSRQDEALQLPYRLLQEVLKSDRLTSLSEEEIWKVRDVRPPARPPAVGLFSPSRLSPEAFECSVVWQHSNEI